MVVGILGGGQLARMLVLAGYPLGLRFAVLDPAADACAFPLAEALHGGYTDEHQVARLAQHADVVTYEFENVSRDSSGQLEQQVPVYPSFDVLALKQDRWAEKQLLDRLEIPVAPTRPVQSTEELRAAIDALGLPLILKTRAFGYDGKGQARLESATDADAVLQRFGGAALIAEQCIPFEREVSVVAVRGRSGEIAFYDLAENSHRDGILRVSRNRPDDPMTERARHHARRLLEHLDYVGVLALECFELDGRLLANEFAPRVHNSGHWTIEGAETSQFENHLRAIVGLPLGATRSVGHTIMVNCIGQLPETDAVLAIAGAHYHCYDKAPRPRRKVGHITLRADTAELAEAALADLRRVFEP